MLRHARRILVGGMDSLGQQGSAHHPSDRGSSPLNGGFPRLSRLLVPRHLIRDEDPKFCEVLRFGAAGLGASPGGRGKCTSGGRDSQWDFE